MRRRRNLKNIACQLTIVTSLQVYSTNLRGDDSEDNPGLYR